MKLLGVETGTEEEGCWKLKLELKTTGWEKQARFREGFWMNKWVYGGFFCVSGKWGKIRAKEPGHTISSSAVNWWDKEQAQWLWRGQRLHPPQLLTVFWIHFKSHETCSLQQMNPNTRWHEPLHCRHIWRDIWALLFLTRWGAKSLSNSGIEHNTWATQTNQQGSFAQELGLWLILEYSLTVTHLFGPHRFKHLLQQHPHLLDVVHQHARLEKDTQESKKLKKENQNRWRRRKDAGKTTRGRCWTVGSSGSSNIHPLRRSFQRL